MTWRRRPSRALPVLVAGALAGSTPGVALAEPVNFKVERAAKGLDKPTDLAWVPKTKRLFVSEEDTGRIRIINKGRLLRRPCIDLNVSTKFDHGLVGLALDPDFATNKYIYAYYTANTDPPKNRLSRFKVNKGLCRAEKRILGGIGAGRFHQGGQLVFGQGDDDYLFVTTGDNQEASNAQDTDSLLGKVLRLDPDGKERADRAPETNPFYEDGGNRFVWSYGHRNGFGLAYGPGGELFETENGPQCDDELNLIEEGKNYGWWEGYDCNDPPADRPGGEEEPVPPLYRWETSIAPTDATWYEGRLAALSGALYLGDFNKSQLHRFDFPEDLELLSKDLEDVVIYKFPSGTNRIISVSKGPGGWLYVVGRPNIYRLVTGRSAEAGIEDNFFDPQKARVEVGGFVRWTKPASTRKHNVRQRQGLFSSGRATTAAIDYTATFSAGRFPYLCTVHPGMTGVVRVRPTIKEGPPGLPFSLRWATDTTNTGNVFDIDYRIGNRPWTRWKTNVKARAAVFGKKGNPISLQSGKRYSFRVRSGRVRSGGKNANSPWSPVVTKQL